MEHLDIDYNQNDGGTDHHGSILLHPCLPSEFLRPPFKIFGFAAQFVRNIRHMVQFLAAIQNLIDILFHDTVNFSQVLLKLTAILHVSLVTVFALFSLNDWVVVNELKRT